MVLGLNPKPGACQSSPVKMLFEKIGTITTSVNHVHLHFSFNLSTLNEQVHDFVNVVEGLGSQKNPALTTGARTALRDAYDDLHGIAKGLKQDVDDLVLLMSTQNALARQKEHRRKRFLTQILSGFGLLGTFMSLYNTYEIANLQSAVGDIQKQNEQMIDVLQQHETRVATLEADVKKLGDTCQLLASTLGALSEETAVLKVTARVSRMYTVLKTHVDTVTDLITQAMNHRLSVKMVRTRYLLDILARAEKKAKKRGYHLLVTDPLHLLQTETSFVYSHQEISLFVHVPMVRKHGLLTLFKFVPFPITYGKQDETPETILTLEPREQLIGVGEKYELHKAMKVEDLGQCEKVGQTFICKHKSILHKKAEDSCIGSIFFNKVDRAHQICPVLIHNPKETVHQLEGDKFSLFSPSAQQVVINCGDGTHNRINLAPGMGEIPMHGDCQAESERHLFYSDYDINESGRFKQMVFPLNIKKATLHIPESVLTDVSKLIAHLGEVPHDVRDLRNIYDFKNRSPVWSGHYWTWGALLILFLLLAALAISAGILLWRRRQLLRQSQGWIRQVSKRWSRQPANNVQNPQNQPNSRELEMQPLRQGAAQQVRMVELPPIKPSAPLYNQQE